MLQRSSLLLLIAFAGCARPPAASPTAKAATTKAVAKATKVRSVEGIHEFTLSNGLRVLLVPDGTQSTVTVNVTYFVGSLHEGYGETGMAHLLEHMAFKGTPNHHNVMGLIDARGGHGNGSTWNDRTNYFETLSASGDNLEWALGLEADRMVNCSIAEEELKTEFSVVRNEFEMNENDPPHILEERMTSTAYLWHNYGKSTIGSRADIERVPANALRAFYKKYYQPDNALLVVSGKLDTEGTLASIEKAFGGIEKPVRVLAAPYSVEPVQDGERTVTLRRNGDLHVVGTTYHTVAGASPDYAAVSAAVSILTRKPSGRLYSALVATKLAANVSGDDYEFRDPGVATFMVQVRDPKNLPAVREKLVAIVESLGSAKIEAAELERWRNRELKEFDLLFSDSERVAVQLSEYAALGDWRTLFAHREQVKKVTLEDVGRVAKAYFKASNRTLGEFVPTKDADRAPYTETPDVAAIVKGIEGGAGGEAGENFAATIENIEARTVRQHLKGGLEAAFLTKKNRGGKVHLAMKLRYGDETSLANKSAVAALTASLLSRGTKKHSYQELRDEEDKVRSQIRIHGDAGALSVEVESFRDQLPGALDLVTEMLTMPSFPEKELELARQEALARLEEQLSDPQSLAWSEIRRVMSPWPKSDPRYAMSPAEAIAAYKRVTLADVTALYRDFLGASHGEIAVIGDFDAAAVGAKLESSLGAWTSKKPFARLAAKLFDVAGTQKQLDVKDKEMATLAFGADIALRDDNPDYPAWLVLGQVLGGDLGSRLWMRLREKEGLSYGVGAWTFAGSLDEVGGTFGYAIVAPQNADKAIASIVEEVKRAQSGAVSVEELRRSKEGWAKSLDTDLSKDSFVAEKLVDGLYVKRTLAWQGELRTKVLAVSADDVARVAKKYLNPDKFVVIKAGDFAKK